MATIRAPSASFLSAFLPVVRARLLPQEQSIQRIPLLQQLEQLRQKASLLPAVLVPIPSILGQLWDGLLNAVPKKKTSHMKKRHRQMAGKALKDVTALNKCSACGRLKRAHVLCPYCVQSIRQWVGKKIFNPTPEQLDWEAFQKRNKELKAKGKSLIKWENRHEDRMAQEVMKQKAALREGEDLRGEGVA